MAFKFNPFTGNFDLVNPATDISGKASLALDNLASVAINTSLISDTDSTDDLGSSSRYWNNGYIDKIYAGSLTLRDDSSETITGSWGMKLGGNGTHPVQINAPLLVGITASGSTYTVGSAYFGDNNAIFMGTGTDASIYYDGTNLVVNPKLVGTGNVNVLGDIAVSGTKVIGARVVDARCDDAINSGDATTDGVIDSLRDAMIAHGLIAAA